MITRFEALVSRESLAGIFLADEIVTVVKITPKHSVTNLWTVLVERADGGREYADPCALDPSAHLKELIRNGTYNEGRMQWCGPDGYESLSY